MPQSALVALGKTLIAGGLLIAAAGMLLYIIGRTGIQWPDLPGDFTLRFKNITIQLPIATSIIISIALSIILSFIFYIAGLLRR